MNDKLTFSHLHVHSEYSIKDGMMTIPKMVDKAIASGMNAIALTDHGFMGGVQELFEYCDQLNVQRISNGQTPFKPIAGCEVFVDTKAYHLVLLAKNLKGYQNLCHIVSSGFLLKTTIATNPVCHSPRLSNTTRG